MTVNSCGSFRQLLFRNIYVQAQTKFTGTFLCNSVLRIRMVESKNIGQTLYGI